MATPCIASQDVSHYAAAIAAVFVVAAFHAAVASRRRHYCHCRHGWLATAAAAIIIFCHCRHFITFSSLFVAATILLHISLRHFAIISFSTPPLLLRLPHAISIIDIAAATPMLPFIAFAFIRHFTLFSFFAIFFIFALPAISPLFHVYFRSRRRQLPDAIAITPPPPLIAAIAAAAFAAIFARLLPLPFRLLPLSPSLFHYATAISAIAATPPAASFHATPLPHSSLYICHFLRSPLPRH